MITASDFVSLPYTPDLTRGGITYAVRSLPHTYDRMGGSSFNRLRRIVAGVGCELALRRHLSRMGVPYDVRGATPFTDPDRYDVSLGGHRCDLKSFLITKRAQIASLRAHPEQLLDAPALVPLDQHAGAGHHGHELYLFAFLTALVTASRSEFRKALEAGQQAYLLHPLPRAWSRPDRWVPLAPLAVKSEAGHPVRLEIGGQSAERTFLARELELRAGARQELADSFYALAYLHIDRLPEARIGLHSRQMGVTYVITPFQWGNIWVYGMQIVLAGYLPYEQFQRRSRLLPAGSRVFQYDRTRTKNLAVPVRELRPLAELFEQVKGWADARARED